MTEVEVTTSGSPVRVDVGDEIVVRVPETPTTGYHWTVSAIDPQLTIVSNAYFAADTGGTPAPGAGGLRVIRLKAESPGQAGAELSLQRPWEESVERTFRVSATIAA